jgi:hypothetical protein
VRGTSWLAVAEQPARRHAVASAIVAALMRVIFSPPPSPELNQPAGFGAADQATHTDLQPIEIRPVGSRWRVPSWSADVQQP